MKLSGVAPLVGAWIETKVFRPSKFVYASHPSWVRGLKLVRNTKRIITLSRTPRGCVD